VNAVRNRRSTFHETRTLAGHELKTILLLPQTYAVATAYLIISGIMFVSLLVRDNLPDLERYFSNMHTTLIVLVPIVAIRTFAEERRTGVLDVSLSWPVSRVVLVFTKYVATTLFLWSLVSVTWLYTWLLSRLGSVEIGRVVGGYAGLLLLTAAFNALATAVSALAASPVGAAFSSFGLLLSLWLLNFVPGWFEGGLGRVFVYLSPLKHLEAMGRGAVDAGDVLYFVSLVVLGLGVAVWAIQQKGTRSYSLVGLAARPLEARAALMLGVLVAFAAVTVAAQRVEAQIDLTPTKRFTLSSASRAVLARMKQKGAITVTAFVDGDSPQAVEITSLIRNYQVAGADIKLHLIDPDRHPAEVKEYGIERYGQFVFEMGKKREIVNDANESAFTSGMLRLARQKPSQACFITGHGERSPEDQNDYGASDFAVQLRLAGYQSRELALAAPGGAELLQHCDVVLDLGAERGFLPEEAELLRRYAEGQGRIVFMAGDDPRGIDQVNSLAEPWGLHFDSRYARDRSSLADDPGSIVSYQYPSQSPVTSDLKFRNIPVLFTGSRTVGIREGLPAEAWISPLVRTSQHSYGDDKTGGPFTLAAIADWGKIGEDKSGVPGILRRRIAAVGTVEPAVNRFFRKLGNSDFMVSLVQWVGVEDDILNASRAQGGTLKIVLTQQKKSNVVRYGIVVPGLLPILGFAVCVVRLKKG
jgi:ABC-2 type transport system permease protein